MGKLPNAEILKKIYDQGFSIKKIAKIYGVSHQAVSSKLKTSGYAIDKANQHSKNQKITAMTSSIIRYRKKGYSYAKIEKLTNVSASTCKRICNENEVVKGERHTSLSDYELDQIKTFRRKGLSYKDIGEILGYDTMTVWRANKEAKDD